MDEWTLRAAREASEAQQGLFKAELEEPVVLDETTSDKLAASRGFWNAVGFMAGVYLLAGFVVAVLLLW